MVDRHCSHEIQDPTVPGPSFLFMAGFNDLTDLTNEELKQRLGYRKERTQRDVWDSAHFSPISGNRTRGLTSKSTA